MEFPVSSILSQGHKKSTTKGNSDSVTLPQKRKGKPINNLNQNKTVKKFLSQGIRHLADQVKIKNYFTYVDKKRIDFARIEKNLKTSSSILQSKAEFQEVVRET